MRMRVVYALMIAYAGLVSGCVSVLPEPLSPQIEAQELSGHVYFLAQPALGGRKPQTRQSRTVQKYLQSRFSAYGLVPWGLASGYKQSFGYGTNVIGVLPGSDPNLANEIVILCAHYDHLGRDKKGIHPGACDNASGVAVMLEIAEYLALSENRPRRSVCFAAFDREEDGMLGSLAFTCREDFDRSRIAASVNLDMLGRAGFDVLDKALFLVGSRAYPQWRTQITQAGTEAGLRILPVGTDMIGPRGDHLAFESLSIPALFFSCGMFNDYHKPTDTAEKLDYEYMRRSALTILQTVEMLTDARLMDRPVTPEGGGLDELKAVAWVLTEMGRHCEKAGLNFAQCEQVRRLAEQAEKKIAAESYSRQDRRTFCRRVGEVLGPLLMGSLFSDLVAKGAAESNDRISGIMAIAQAAWLDHRVALTRGIRQFVIHLLEHRPGVIRNMPPFLFKCCDLVDDELSFVEQDDGRYALNALLTELRIRCVMKGWPLRKPAFGFGQIIEAIDCVGDRDEIADYCLLSWREDANDPSYNEAFCRILRTVTSQSIGQTRDQWLQWRLTRGRWPDRQHWVLAMMQSPNPALAYIAVKNAHTLPAGSADETIPAVIRNPAARSDVRAAAIQFVSRSMGRKALAALVDVLADQSPSRRKEFLAISDESYPFLSHPIIELSRTQITYQQSSPETLGQLAQQKLKTLTAQDFGDDALAWWMWIEDNWPQ